MIKNLQLAKPLACFDLETTGVNTRLDRIIELAMVRLMPDGTSENHEFRFNPGIPIPPGATAVHGIKDEDVKDCPSFASLAPQIHKLFEGCDLAGFGIIRFDIPLLAEEFARADLTFDEKDRHIFDAQAIYHKRESRTLTAALAFYCGITHPNAHSALADAQAALQVLDAQYDKYPDLPRNPDELDRYCRPSRSTNWADRTGKLKWENGEIVINFGVQYLGRRLRELAQNNQKFLKWIISSDFPFDTRQIAQDALDGKFPQPPPEAGRSSEA